MVNPDVATLALFAVEVCDLCEDDYPATSERGLALERLRNAAIVAMQARVVKPESGEGGK